MRFYSCYAFDLDGTLYRGQEVVDGAVEALANLRAKGAKILYLTNNSGLTQAQYVHKLESMGFEAHEDEVVSSGLAAAYYCLSEGYKKVFVVGEPGLVKTFQEHGLEVINTDTQGRVGPSESQADVVVSGICREALSYKLLDSAMQIAIKTQRYVACNTDLTYPVEGGRFCPGSGAIVAAIEACSGVTATVVGKPNPTILTSVLNKLGISPSETIMVGDRLDTDIACGKAAGCDTMLVLTGVVQEPVDGQAWIHSVKDLV